MNRPRNTDIPFFEYHVQLHAMGFRPFFARTVAASLFDLGRYKCEGRSYYLCKHARHRERTLWDTTLIFFYDPKQSTYPCVKTMIKAHNYFTMHRAHEFVEMTKVFDLCS